MHCVNKIYLLSVLVEDVLAHEVRPLKLLARERAEPLVLAQLLRVGLDELLHLVVLVLHAQLAGLVVVEGGPGLQEGAHLLLEDGAVVLDLGRCHVAGGGHPAGVHDAAPVGHLVLVGVLGVVVEVDGVDHAQVEEQTVEDLDELLVADDAVA